MTIVNRFYDAYEAEVAASPEGHAMDYVHCFMVVGKKKLIVANESGATQGIRSGNGNRRGP